VGVEEGGLKALTIIFLSPRMSRWMLAVSPSPAAAAAAAAAPTSTFVSPPAPVAAAAAAGQALTVRTEFSTLPQSVVALDTSPRG